MLAPKRLRDRRRARFRAQRGFTLIELGIVLALLAVTAAVAIPELGQITDANVRSQSRLIGGAIEYASTQAVTRRRIYRLYFDLDKGRYWLAARNAKGVFRPFKYDPLGRSRPLLDGVSFKSVFVVDQVYNKGVTYAEFLPDGTVDPLLINLDTEYDDEYTVVVDQMTATATIEPGEITPKEYQPEARELRR